MARLILTAGVAAVVLPRGRWGSLGLVLNKAWFAVRLAVAVLVIEAVILILALSKAAFA